MASKSWTFTESSHKTAVGMNKTEVKFQKELATLERQQNTAVTNIANYQQAMKMSWRRLEERRVENINPSKRVEKNKEDGKNGVRQMMLQSKTKLYVDKTPDIYNPDSHSTEDTVRKTTVDDSVIDKGFFLRGSSRKGPPPTALNSGIYASPYLSSPYSFRRVGPIRNIQTADATTRDRSGSSGGSATNLLRAEGSESKLSYAGSSTDVLSASSQPLLIKSGSTNKKDTLLKASTMMDLDSSSSGPKAFASFYGKKVIPSSGVISPLASSLIFQDNTENKQDKEAQMHENGNDDMTLEEMFDEIRNCRYIRHYYPNGTV